MVKTGIQKVCVLGLGTVGYPTAQHIHDCGFEVYGYDIRPIRSDNFFTTCNYDDVPKDVNVYVVTVSSGRTRGKTDLRALFDVCSKISKSNNANVLVCIESTVPIGTCKKLAEIHHLSHLVYVPHRYWSGDPERHGVKQLRVFGAINEQSMVRGLEFYKQLGIPLHVVPRIEIAEACKIVENAYRFVQIAFVEDLRIICDYLGLDFKQVRKACNTKWNIRLLEARDGIQGHCLPKDVYYLLSHSRSSLVLEGAIRTDKLYKEWLKLKKNEGTDGSFK